MKEKCSMYLGQLQQSDCQVILQGYALEHDYVVEGCYQETDQDDPQYFLAVLLDLAAKGMFDVLLVYDYNCLSRNLYELLIYIQKFKTYGVKVVSYSQQNCKLLNSPMTFYRKNIERRADTDGTMPAKQPPDSHSDSE